MRPTGNKPEVLAFVFRFSKSWGQVAERKNGTLGKLQEPLNLSFTDERHAQNETVMPDEPRHTSLPACIMLATSLAQNEHRNS
jgi:hypothetical protein